MGKNGGKREGAGRKKGVPNKDRRAFMDLIHKVGKPEELIAKLKELTNGVTCIKYEKDGEEKIYEKPPDPYAITYLLDQAYGKAKQSVELETSAVTWEDLLAVDVADESESEKGKD